MPSCFGTPVGRRRGPGQHEAPVGPVGERGPHLLAGRRPLVAVGGSVGPGGDVGQVAAGVRLGVALAPQLLARHDRRQEPGLLLRRAEGDHGRAEQRLADVAQPAGRPGPGVLLVVDDVAAERAGPGRRAPWASRRRSSRARRGAAPTPAARRTARARRPVRPAPARRRTRRRGSPPGRCAPRPGSPGRPRSPAGPRPGTLSDTPSDIRRRRRRRAATWRRRSPARGPRRSGRGGRRQG